jgi:uncharacterized protein (DUF488 family)
MGLFTIGFTKKGADHFFETLIESGVKRVVDVRLNNVSQLAGFAKRDDLKYFLKSIGDIDYIHVPELAPTKEIFEAYKKNKGPWETFEENFLALMKERKIERTVSKELVNGGCLLCSEDQPHHCHRRLVAEYLQREWNEDLGVKHLT